jgi:hypothetical protein
VLYREILNLVSTREENSFVMANTSQLHASYNEYYVVPEGGIEVSGDYGKRRLAVIADYVNEIKNVDNAIKTLVQGLEESGEPTILILYSDHQPALNLLKKSGIEDKYSVPYVVWDNIGLEKEDKDLTLSDLFMYILDKSGVDASIYTDFYKAYKNDENYSSIKELVMYDMSFGKNYLEEKSNSINENIKIGYGEISVSNATKVEENKYKVEGWNITEFTKLICDGRVYELEYGGPMESYIVTNDDLVGKECYLEVVISESRKTRATSNTFIFN